MPGRHAGRSGGSSLTNCWCWWFHVRLRWGGALGVAGAGGGVWRVARLGVSRPRVVGVTAAGGVLCWGILADVSVGGGVCPVCVAGVAGSLSRSCSCGVTTGVGTVTRVARSS